MIKYYFLSILCLGLTSCESYFEHKIGTVHVNTLTFQSDPQPDAITGAWTRSYHLNGENTSTIIFSSDGTSYARSIYPGSDPEFQATLNHGKVFSSEWQYKGYGSWQTTHNGEKLREFRLSENPDGHEHLVMMIDEAKAVLFSKVSD